MSTTNKRVYGPFAKNKQHEEEPAAKRLKLDNSSSAESSSDEEDNIEQSTPSLSQIDKVKLMREQMGLPPLNEEQTQKQQQHQYTQQEIRSLKETQSLFQSSLFKIAFGEVLKQVGIKWEKNKSIEIALHQLKRSLDSMREGYKVKDLNFVQYLKDHSSVNQPFDDLIKYLNEYTSSKKKNLHEAVSKAISASNIELNIIGSFLLRSVAKPNACVDVSISIPDQLLTDLSNHNYFVMRAAYLTSIAQYLSSVPMFASNLKFEAFRGDSLKPVLVLSPTKDPEQPKFTKTPFKIRLFISIPSSAAKSVSEKSTIASSLIKKKSATPLYNHLIQEDVNMKKHLELIHNEMKDCASLVEASILLKVWSRQRGIYGSYDGVNGFLFTVLLIYLLKKNVITKHQSSFQMMKHVMQWIVNNKDLKQSFNADANLNDFAKHFDCVLLLDQFNLFHRVSKSAWKELRYEALLTLKYFEDDQKVEAIQALFLTKQNIWHKYDLHLLISTGGNVRIPNYDQQIAFSTQLRNTISTLLLNALGQRVHFIRVVSDDGAADRDQSVIVVGIMLSKKWNIDNQLIVGPSPSDKQAVSAFQDFWGDLVEMKRLGSGKTAMVVEWKTPSATANDPSIVTIEQICQYILNKHLKGLSKMDVELMKVEFDSDREELSQIEQTLLKKRMNEAFDRIKDDISSTDVQLNVKEVAIAGPHPYLLTPFPHLMNENIRKLEKIASSESVLNSIDSYHVAPIPVVLEYLDNAQWPDSIKAIQKLKQLIYIRLSQQLSLPSIANTNWVDVMCNGYAFRLVILLSKEIQIFKSTGNAMEPKLITMERKLVHTSLHYTYMNIITSHFSAFTGTVQLAKRWVHSQMFSDYINEEVIELICAHIFTSPYPYKPPKTITCGFIRFIHFVSNFSWSDTPLLINCIVEDEEDEEQQVTRYATKKVILSSETSNERMAEEAALQQIREEYEKLQVKPAIYVVASYNKQLRNVFTKDKPDSMVVNRLVKCAKQSHEQLMNLYHSKTLGEDESPSSATNNSIWQPDLNVYDVVIHLDEAFHKGNGSGILENESKYRERLSRKTFEIGFDPVSMYVNDLRSRLEQFGFLFRNATSDTCVAIVWNPAAFIPLPFNITKSIGQLPLNSSPGKTLPNVIELLNDIQNIGQGIVAKVELISHSNKLTRMSK